MATQTSIKKYKSWIVEPVQFRVRKTDEYGSPYSGIAHFTVANGSLHIEGLLCNEFTKNDYIEFAGIAEFLGFQEATIVRNGHCKVIKAKSNEI